MKFLCLAYGSAEDWEKLTEQDQQSFLAQDDVLRKRGDIVNAVEPAVTTVTNHDEKLCTKNEPFAITKRPLAGFSNIEADTLNEAIKLISNTPCARAKGAVEIWPVYEKEKN